MDSSFKEVTDCIWGRFGYFQKDEGFIAKSFTFKLNARAFTEKIYSVKVDLHHWKCPKTELSSLLKLFFPCINMSKMDSNKSNRMLLRSMVLGICKFSTRLFHDLNTRKSTPFFVIPQTFFTVKPTNSPFRLFICTHLMHGQTNFKTLDFWVFTLKRMHI